MPPSSCRANVPGKSAATCPGHEFRTSYLKYEFAFEQWIDLPEETVRSHLPAQLRIAPVERIRQLVNAAMPGIGLQPLPVAPRQIPFHAGFCYFQLEPKSEYWNELKQSGGFAIHVGGDFPGLELEFWAIRG